MIPQSLRQLQSEILETITKENFTGKTPEEIKKNEIQMDKVSLIIDKLEMVFYTENEIPAEFAKSIYPYIFNGILFFEECPLKDQHWRNNCVEKLFNFLYKILSKDRLDKIITIATHMFECGKERVELVTVSLINEIVSLFPEETKKLDIEKTLTTLIINKLNNYVGKEINNIPNQETFYRMVLYPYKADVLFEISKLICTIVDQNPSLLQTFSDVIESTVLVFKNPLPPLSTNNFKVLIQLYQAFCKFALIYIRANSKNESRSEMVRTVHQRFLCLANDSFTLPRDLFQDGVNTLIEIGSILEKAEESLKNIDIQPNSRLLVVFNKVLEMVAKSYPKALTTSAIINLFNISWRIITSHRLGIHNMIHAIKFIKQVFDNICPNKNVSSEVKRQSAFTIKQFTLLMRHFTVITKLIIFLPNPSENIKHFFWNTTSRNTPRIIENAFEFLKPMVDMLLTVTETFQNEDGLMDQLIYEFFKQCVHYTIMCNSDDEKQTYNKLGLNIPSLTDTMKRILSKIQSNNKPDSIKQIYIVKKSVRYLLKRAFEINSNETNKILSIYDDFLLFFDKYVTEETFTTFYEYIEKGKNIEDIAILFKKVCYKIKSYIDPLFKEQNTISNFSIAEYQQTFIFIVGKCFKKIGQYLTIDDQIEVEPYVIILDGLYSLYSLEIVSSLNEKNAELFTKIYMNNPNCEVPFFYLSEYISSLTDLNELIHLPSPLLKIAESCLRLPLPADKLVSFMFISLPIASSIICLKKAPESLRSAAYRYLSVVCTVCPPSLLYKYIPSVDLLKKTLATILSNPPKQLSDFPTHENINPKQSIFCVDEPFKSALISSLAALEVLPSDTPKKEPIEIQFTIQLDKITITFDLEPYYEDYINKLEKEPEKICGMYPILKQAIKQQCHPYLLSMYFITLEKQSYEEKLNGIHLKEIRDIIKYDMMKYVEGFIHYFEIAGKNEEAFTIVCNDFIQMISENGGIENNRESISYLISLISRHEQTLGFDLHALEFIHKYSLKYNDWLSIDSHITVRYLFDVTQREYHNGTITRILDVLLSPTSLDSIIQTIDDSLPRWLHDLFSTVVQSNSPHGIKYIIEFFKSNIGHPETSLLLLFNIDPKNPNYNEMIKYQIQILYFLMPTYKDNSLYKEKVHQLYSVKIPRQYIIKVDLLFQSCCNKEDYYKFVIQSMQSKDNEIASYFCNVCIKSLENDKEIIEKLIENIDENKYIGCQHVELFDFLLNHTNETIKEKTIQRLTPEIDSLKEDMNKKKNIHSFLNKLNGFIQFKYSTEGISSVLNELKEMGEYEHLLSSIPSLKRVLNIDPQQTVSIILSDEKNTKTLLELLASIPDLQLFDYLFQPLLNNSDSLWKKEQGPIILLPFLVKYSKQRQFTEEMSNAIISLSYSTSKMNDVNAKLYTKLLLHIMKYQTSDAELIRQVLSTLQTGEQEKYHFVMLYFIMNFPNDVKNLLLTMRAINEAVDGKWRLLVYALQYVIVPLIRVHHKEFTGNVLDELKKMLSVIPNNNNVTLFDEVQGTQLHVIIEIIQNYPELLDSLRNIVLEKSNPPTSLHNACLKLHAQLLVFTPTCGISLESILEDLLTLPINEIYFNSISIGNIEVETIQHLFESSLQEHENICKIILRHINSPYQENLLPFTFPVKYFFVFYKQRKLFVPTILRSIQHFGTKRELIKCIDLSELIVNWERFRVKKEGLKPLSEAPVLVNILKQCLQQNNDNESLFPLCKTVVVNNFKEQALSLAQAKNKSQNQVKNAIKRLSENIESILTIWGSESKEPILTYDELTKISGPREISMLRDFLVASAKATPPVLYDGFKIVFDGIQNEPEKEVEQYVPLVSGYLTDPKKHGEMQKILNEILIPKRCFSCVKEYVIKKKIDYINGFKAKMGDEFKKILKEANESPLMAQKPVCEKLKDILDIWNQVDREGQDNYIWVLGTDLFETLAATKTQLSGEGQLVNEFISMMKSGRRIEQESLLKNMGNYFTKPKRPVVESQRVEFLEYMLKEDENITIRTCGMENESTNSKYIDKFVSKLTQTTPESLLSEIVKKSVPNNQFTEKWVGVLVSIFIRKLSPDNILSGLVLTNQKLAENIFISLISTLIHIQEKETENNIARIYKERKEFGEHVLIQVICENNIDIGNLTLWDPSLIKIYGKSVKYLRDNFIKYNKPELLSQLYTFIIKNPIEKYHLLAPLIKNERLKQCMEQFPRRAESLHNIMNDILIEMQKNKDPEIGFASELKIDLALMLNLTDPLKKYGEIAIKICKNKEEKRRVNDLLAVCSFRKMGGEKDYINGDDCLQYIHLLCNKLTPERADRSGLNAEFSKDLLKLVESFENKIKWGDLNEWSVLNEICQIAIILREFIETQYFMYVYCIVTDTSDTFDKVSSYSTLFTLESNTKDLYIVRKYAIDHHKKTFQSLANKKNSVPSINAIVLKFEKLDILNQIEYARYHRRMGLFSPAITILEELEERVKELQGTSKTHSDSLKPNDEINSLLIRISLEKVLNANALERPLQMVNIMQSTYENYIQPYIESPSKNTEEINMFFRTLKVLQYPSID
ncbi:hypothetical protein EHI8A_057080 [Entamoeba histolytica HM-1:IMSS-B]|uniref:Uncharacterized protein n=2 Tax=Entamoeba histolytica TaxID=5759 RepID=A0A175JFM0_ENTHI|nr:hypothetical protein EHI8A_057080 [Entamoeba histolytica HM-1:IMSS-B]GAT92365.1 hypothetical protein CL6EHI_178440 [Entamoeba histolytica]